MSILLLVIGGYGLMLEYKSFGTGKPLESFMLTVIHIGVISVGLYGLTNNT